MLVLKLFAQCLIRTLHLKFTKFDTVFVVFDSCWYRIGKKLSLKVVWSFYCLQESLFFSSPELKAQFSFSDQNLLVFRRCWCCCCKISTISSSSSKSPDQFQPNLAQPDQFPPNLAQGIYLKGVQVFLMKGHALFSGEIVRK